MSCCGATSPCAPRSGPRSDKSVQVIAPTAELRLPVVDLAVLPAERREAEALRLATEEAQRPFDLERGPLLRATLLKLEEQEHVLLLNMHHIVSDGWSMGVLVREVAALYAGLLLEPALAAARAAGAVRRLRRLAAPVAARRGAGAPALLLAATVRRRRARPGAAHRQATATRADIPRGRARPVALAGAERETSRASANERESPPSCCCCPPSRWCCGATRGRRTSASARPSPAGIRRRSRASSASSSTPWRCARAWRAIPPSVNCCIACGRPRWALTPTSTFPSRSWWKSSSPSATWAALPSSRCCSPCRTLP